MLRSTARTGRTAPAASAARAAAAIVTTALALAAGGCLELASLPPNLPPHTSLSIHADTLNLSDYRTILSWWGTDTDGRVIGYAYRWDGPWRPAPDDSLWWDDPSWTFTTAGRDTFDVPVGGSYAERTFTVRAIDDDLEPDPDPPRQLFRLTNAPPTVAWTDTTRHPTRARPSLPAISFAWRPEDFDGPETIAWARLWLDTEPGEDSAAAAIAVVGDTVGAFSREHFQGRLGTRTVSLQVFDRAATGSNVVSWTWNVVAPAGEYLLIDNAGEPTPGPQQTDDLFWRARLDALVPGNYHVYDVWEEGPFRSRQEVLPLLRLFRGVVWYGGKSFDGSEPSDRDLRTGLDLAHGAFGDYVREGGHIFVTGHNLVGTAAALPRSFWERQFGIREVYTHYVPRLEEWISDMDLPRRQYDRDVHVRCAPALGDVDSLRINSPITMTDYFAIGENLAPLLWLDPATVDTTLIPAHAAAPVYIAAAADWGTGRIALATTILTRFRRGPNGTPEEAATQLLRVVLALP